MYEYMNIEKNEIGVRWVLIYSVTQNNAISTINLYHTSFYCAKQHDYTKHNKSKSKSNNKSTQFKVLSEITFFA